MLFLRWYLWIAPQIVVVACLFLVVRRKLATQYTLLLPYFLFQLAQFIVFVIIGWLSDLSFYRRMMVGSAGVQILLELGILYQLADDLILHHRSLTHTFSPLFRWTAAILILVAAGSSAALPQSGLERALRLFQTLDFSASLLKLGLLLTLVLFTRILRISWRSLPAGLVLGFGVAASTELVGSALFSVLGSRRAVDIDILRLTGFHLCVLIWLIYMLIPDTSRAVTNRISESQLREWNEEIQKFTKRLEAR